MYGVRSTEGEIMHTPIGVPSNPFQRETDIEYGNFTDASLFSRGPT